MVVECKYVLKEFVYLVTDPDQHRRQITQLKITPTGLLYGVNFGTIFSEHYEFELSAVEDTVLKTT